jgi:murein DD-endopeptidase MepM/ murein hydrolase activator NlpD
MHSVGNVDVYEIHITNLSVEGRSMRNHHLRVFVVVLVTSLLITLTAGSAAAAGYAVAVDGQTVQEAMAEMRDGQLAVAVRPMVEAMGGWVSWNSTYRRLDLGYRGTQMAMWEGTTKAFQDGKALWMPFPLYLNNNGRAMAPAWWLAVRLGATVRFDGTTLYVTTGRQPASAHPLMNPNYYFPYAQGAPYGPYTDTMGDPRYYDGRTFAHEGTDIPAPKGTPIYAVAAGQIVRYGWNTLGGYRITIQLDDHPEYRFYYAHLDRYAPGLYLGAKVKAGQLLGYTGNTGEGPERTEGKFIPHLHFGIYGPNGAINSYPFLRYWEQHKVQP